jgi:hypothetical protein
MKAVVHDAYGSFQLLRIASIGVQGSARSSSAADTRRLQRGIGGAIRSSSRVCRRLRNRERRQQAHVCRRLPFDERVADANVQQRSHYDASVPAARPDQLVMSTRVSRAAQS